MIPDWGSLEIRGIPNQMIPRFAKYLSPAIVSDEYTLRTEVFAGSGYLAILNTRRQRIPRFAKYWAAANIADSEYLGTQGI